MFVSVILDEMRMIDQLVIFLLIIGVSVIQGGPNSEPLGLATPN